MASPIALWGPRTLGGVVTLMTGGAGVLSIVTRAVFTNTDSTSRTITVWVVRKGSTRGTTNIVIDAQSIFSDQAYVAPALGNLVLNSGDQIQAQASVDNVVNTVGSGFTW